MTGNNFFQKLLGKKSKTEILIEILTFLLDYKKASISVAKLKRKFPKTFPQIEKIFKDYEFISIKWDTPEYEVKNYNLLKEELTKLIREREEKRHHESERTLQILSFSLTAYLILFTIFQFAVTLPLELRQTSIAQQSLNLQEISMSADLIFTDSNVADGGLIQSFDNITRTIHFKLCVMNRGSVDSGNIHLDMNGTNMNKKSVQLGEIKAKSYNCTNQTVTLNNNASNETQLEISLSCLNCKGTGKQTYTFQVKP